MKKMWKKIVALLAIVLLMCGAIMAVNNVGTVNEKKTAKYGPWIIPKGYTAGEMVSFAGKDWMALHAIAPMTDVAPTVSAAWAEVQ